MAVFHRILPQYTFCILISIYSCINYTETKITSQLEVFHEEFWVRCS